MIKNLIIVNHHQTTQCVKTNLGRFCEGLPLNVVLTGHDLGLKDRADEDEGDEERADQSQLPLVINSGANGQQDGEDGLHHGAESTAGRLKFRRKR